MTWIFINTYVRISQPTVVPKRRQETTNRRCVKSPKECRFHLRRVLKPEITQLWKCYSFCYQHAKRMHRLRLAGYYIYCYVHVFAGHFRYEKIIPQQVKGKKKWVEIITWWGCLWWKFTVKNRRLNTEYMPSEHSDSDEQDPAACKFLSNSLLCMLWRYNGKGSINWLWFGSL